VCYAVFLYPAAELIWLKISDANKYHASFSLQELTQSSDANLMRSMMNLFDTFMDDFCDEKNVQKMPDLDQRAQLEVSTHFFSHISCLYS